MTNSLIKLLRLFPDKPWNWGLLSSNPNISWEIVKDNLDKSWSWDKLGANPNITWEIVRNNPGYPWNSALLSNNPNITWEIVKDNPDYSWDWFHLSYNKFKHDENLQNISINKLKLFRMKIRHLLSNKINIY